MNSSSKINHAKPDKNRSLLVYVLPKCCRPFALLSRIDKPIGTWLLLWPCFWSISLAENGLPDIRLLALFAVGALVMRSAGCVLNDIIDSDLDALTQLNTFTIYVGLGSAGLIVIYPFMKRITHWPQIVLGLAFNWGALLGWASVEATLGWSAGMLYLGGIAWTLGYDTIYAHMDKSNDIEK